MITKYGILGHNINEVGPSDGLVCWWKLDGDTLDYAGDCDLTNTGCTVSTGNGQMCYLTSSTSTYMRNTNLPSTVIGNNPITLSCWFNLVSRPNTSNYNSFVWIGTENTKNCILSIGMNGGSVNITSAKYSNDLTSGISAVVGTWYHVVTTLDPNVAHKIYVNGVLKNTQGSPATNTRTNTISIGCSASSTAYYSNAYIQDVRIYNRILTDQEVSLLYNFGMGKPMITNNTVYCKNYSEVLNG